MLLLSRELHVVILISTQMITMQNTASSIGPTLASMTSRRQIQDGGPHDFRSKMAAPTTSDPRWRPPRNQDGGPCDAFGYTSEGESTP